jgi:ankyrin repeat protein
MTTDRITTLHLAAERGDNAVVELLLANGAKTDVTAIHAVYPGTPLDWAERVGHEDVADLLRQHKAAE